jgi:hypothetical protein
MREAYRCTRSRLLRPRYTVSQTMKRAIIVALIFSFFKLNVCFAVGKKRRDHRTDWPPVQSDWTSSKEKKKERRKERKRESSSGQETKIYTLSRNGIEDNALFAAFVGNFSWQWKRAFNCMVATPAS